MVKPRCVSFRVMKANFSDVQIFRIFTVVSVSVLTSSTEFQNSVISMYSKSLTKFDWFIFFKLGLKKKNCLDNT